MERMYFSPTNNTLVLQASGRVGLSKNIDCGGAISLYALGADCKWNWYRGDWLATAISLGGSGTWEHIEFYSKYTYSTTESHFPVEAWFPFGGAGRSIVLVVDPFGVFKGEN